MDFKTGLTDISISRFHDLLQADKKLIFHESAFLNTFYDQTKLKINPFNFLSNELKNENSKQM